MKILRVTEATVFLVKTAENEYGFYTRSNPTCWSWCIGEYKETLFDCKEIEASYQEWIKEGNKVER